jgi:LysM repeat protein
MKSPSATTQSFAPTPAPVQVKAPAGVPAGGAVDKNTTPSAALPQAQTAGITPVDRAASGGRTPSASPVPPSAEGAARTYTVKRGDNPWSIAKSQGVSYDDLMKINGLQDPKKLQLNQILKLPPKKAVN